MGDDWIFDSLIGFLRGPVWNVPILTFVEHKSLVFEPGDEGKNEVEYKKIFDDYKNLVDFMLGSYMDDIGITPEQFEEACGRGKGKIRSQFQHGLFEQVWAADDYEIFKRMMIQKNIELQLQALELLQQRYGILPEVLQPGVEGGGEAHEEEDEDKKNEDQVMQQIVKQSKAEHEAMLAALNEEEAQLEKALASSVDEHKRLAAEKQNQEALFVEQMKKSNITDTAVLGYGDVSAPVSVPDRAEQVDPEELLKRTAFLKQQRDKLLALKKAEREKQLAVAEASHAKERPKSARAARSALGSGRHKIDPRTLEVRKSLARKLMAEVVHQEED